MIAFWCGAAGLALLACVMLFGPSLLGWRGRTDSAAGPNLAVLRQQLASLDAEFQAGVIDREEHGAARSEIGRRLLQEASPASPRASTVARKPAGGPAAVWLAICIPLAAFITYGFVGNLDGTLQGPVHAVPPAGAPPAAEVESMLDDMARRMQSQPPGAVDAQGWAFVARSYAAIGRHEEAGRAYALATDLAPDDISLRAERDRVVALVQAEHPSNAPARLSGTIKVAPELASRVRATDTVFVFAREAGATGMPLAAARYPARDLPLAYTLDDSATMGDAKTLANARNLVVHARISHTGDAAATEGDLHGQSAAHGTAGGPVDVTITEVGR